MASHTLDTGKKYIKDIFDKDNFYSVPMYQRPYVWGEHQVAALLEDLTNAMERDKTKEYFIGCMIWNTKEVQDGELRYRCQDILDGQQRFITLYLLQGVLRDLSTNDKLKKKVKERIRQEEDEFDGIPERNRIEFEIREDSEFLQKYILTDGGTRETDELQSVIEDVNREKSVRNMARSILTMQEWWKQKAKTVEDLQKYLVGFYSYLSSKVLALYLATPDNLDDAYNLFTVLNSRGLQLQTSDILRAQNLRVIKDAAKRRKFASKWSDYENAIDEPYNAFDDFLWALVYIKMKYTSDDNRSLNKAFDFMYGRGMLERGSGTFELVGEYVSHYRAIFNDSIHAPEYGNFFINLNYILASTFGSSYIAPVMHYRQCFGDYRMNDFLVRIDNLFSASWLLGKRNLQTRMFIILRRMDECLKGSLHREQAADRLLEDDSLEYAYDDESATTALDIEELYTLLDQEAWGSFSGTRINKTRYLLLKLDLIRSDLDSKLYFDKKKASVEHVMPRKLDEENWAIDESDHEEWLHRLGNIVLLDRRKNSALSNSSYGVKREKYKASFGNRANTHFVFMNYESWNVDTIRNNHGRVLDTLRRYYDANSFDIVKELQKT